VPCADGKFSSGDGVVRTIAMRASDGLKRGMQAVNTGAPISVPVGAGTLGRVMSCHPVSTFWKRASILYRQGSTGLRSDE